jgi:hypothetical protein
MAHRLLVATLRNIICSAAGDAKAARYEPPKNPEALFLAKQEPLHQDLKPWLRVCGSFQALSHPLNVQAPFIEGPFNAHANAAYLFNRRLINEAARKGEWGKIVVSYVEKPYRLSAILALNDKLKEQEYWEAVAFAWRSSENCYQDKHAFKVLFRQVGPKKQQTPIWNMMGEQDTGTWQMLPDKLTVYRGCEPRSRSGWSWTLDVNKAIWFACRHRPKNPLLLQGKINKSDAIAYFHLDGRNESEVVIEPRKVMDVKENRTNMKQARLE